MAVSARLPETSKEESWGTSSVKMAEHEEQRFGHVHRHELFIIRVCCPSIQAIATQLTKTSHSNDVERLREICCNSTAKEQVRRAMNQRSRGLAYEWNLIKLLSPVEVISHRATPQSLEDGSDFPVLYRQAIVRVHALQTLVPRNRKGLSDALVGNSETHAIDEYMVLQKRLYQGIEEDWKVWGTLQGGVDETKLEDWEETLNPDPTAGSRDAQRQPDLPPSGSGPAPAV